MGCYNLDCLYMMYGLEQKLKMVLNFSLLCNNKNRQAVATNIF